MKKFLIILYILSALLPVYAGSINAAAYQSMRASSYRNNYNRQVRNQVMPYWQAQSNFSTRNRMYTNYQNYTNYNNAVNQYNYQRNMLRRRY